MLRLNLILMLLLTICSCTVPKSKIVERCVISIEFNKCRCHQYDPNKDKRVSDSEDKELIYCDRGVVFPLESWIELQVWFNEIKEYRKDQSTNE